MNKSLKISDIVFMNIAALLSVRWFATAGQYGASSVILWILAALLFFIPFALVCAEFGSKFPDHQGGITDWIKEILGDKIAFFASWFYFINNLFYYPALLSFAGVALAYAFFPSLAENKTYIALFVIICFWIGTAINLCGVKFSAIIAKIGALFGNILPICIVFILGFISVVFLKRPIPTDFSPHDFIPHFTSKNLLFLTTLTFAMSGVELTSAFVNQVENAKKNYPKSIFISAFLITVAYILGTLALTMVIAPSHISAASGIFMLIAMVTSASNITFIGSLICVLICLGAVACAIIWSIAAIKIFTDGNDEKFIPKFLKKQNKNNVPGNALITQATIITCLMCLMTIIPSVEMIYRTLIVMSAMMMSVTYLTLLIAYIKMKMNAQNYATIPDRFEVPGKKVGGYLVAIVAICSTSITLFIPIFSPVGNIYLYEAEIIGGPIVFGIIGWIMFKIMQKINA